MGNTCHNLIDVGIAFDDFYRKQKLWPKVEDINLLVIFTYHNSSQQIFILSLL